MAQDGGDTVTTHYRLDGPSVVKESVDRLAGTDETVTYLMGARGPEYRRVTPAGTNPTVTTRWHAYDGLGSVIGEIGEEGDLVLARQLDVYGNARFWAANSGETGGKLKFVGGLGPPSDVETGLVYMRARFMDSITGRNRIGCCRHRKG